MKTALCSQSGFARRIDRYLNSVWYPICLGALCAFSGLGDSSRYTVCMGLIAVTVLLTVLFATDMKPLFAPMLMSFCALGKDSRDSYADQVGDVMLSYNDAAFAFVIGLGILAVTALLLRFWKDGTLRDIWENRSACGLSILVLDVAFLCNGVFSQHWLPIDLAYGALMAFGFTFFYFICVSVARRGQNVAKFACQCMVCTSFLGIAQLGVLFANLQGQGQLVFQMGMLTGDSRNAIELGWGISTSIAGYLVLGIPAAFYLAANHRYSAFSYLLAFGIFGSILVLGCRGPILVGGLAMLIGIVACCFGENKTICRKFALAVGLLIPVSLFIIHLSVMPLPQLVKRLLDATRLNLVAEDGRIALWKRGWEHFTGWPVFGVGFEKGAFVGWEVLRNVFANMYHNILVQFIGAMGLVGLLAFLFHLGQFGLVLRKPSAKKILLMTLPLMILLMSLVDNFFFYLNQQIAYCMFIAVAERKEI